MPRGKPDFSVATQQVAATTTDPGEIYARLEGFSSTDGLGRVVFLDTFINGLSAWRLSRLGAGSIPALVTSNGGIAAAYVSPYGVILSPGGTAGDYSNMICPRYLGKASRVGNEWAIKMPIYSAGTMPKISISFIYRKFGDSTGYRAEIKWNANNDQKWAVNQSGVGLVSIPNTDTTVDASLSDYWVQIKFVADWNTHTYTRLVLGQTAFDLSSYAIPTFGGITVQGYAEPDLLLQSAGTAFTINAGYYILTQDEP